MSAPTARQAILRRDACRSLIVAHYAVRVALAVHHGSTWLLDRLEDLRRRQHCHASDLAVLGGLDPLPERLRR